MIKSLVAAGAMCALAMGARAGAERDLFEEAPWYAGAGIGYIHYEGDELVNPAAYIGLRLGYDYSAFFSVEGGIDIIPTLDATEATGTRKELSGDTSAFAGKIDALFHLRNTEDLHWDPYLSIGGYGIYYADEVGPSNPEFAINAGAGVAYHFNDVWALRGDWRTAIAGADTEFNQLLTLTVDYRWGAEVKPIWTVTGGDIDSDGDGLLDKEEPTYGTDPFNPDTDNDGLSDGQEVKTQKTDPLNPDSDWDALKDGAEVLTYKTNPLDPDTDHGGVKDGHEVIEDNTNPLDPKDDLQLFKLNIEFDYDKHDLKEKYFKDLDVVVKVLQRDPGATARIEGHADKRKLSKRDYNLRLSERRAASVLDYVANVGGIDRSRLTSKGYGFDRPEAPNDTEANMQKNRRTEIYIRRTGGAEQAPTQGAVPVDAGTVAPAAAATPVAVPAQPTIK
jgi:outer membrane protein OmpA-like peptidoglycan-associated protein/opacity protein-like surface antigen